MHLIKSDVQLPALSQYVGNWEEIDHDRINLIHT